MDSDFEIRKLSFGLLTEVVGCIVRITPSGELYNLLAFPEPRPASNLHLICINLHCIEINWEPSQL